MHSKFLPVALISLSLLFLPQIAGAQPTSLFITTGHTGVVNSVAFSHDGELLATGSADNTVRIWNVRNAQVLRTLSFHLADVFAVAFSPDSKWLASAGYDQQVILWHVASGERLRTFKTHTQPVTDVAFSGNGRFLATASRDSTIHIWDVHAGVLRHRIEAHRGRVTALAFHPNSLTLASLGNDHIVKIWNVETGRWVAELNHEGAPVTDVVFSPDGRLLATTALDGVVRMWRSGAWQMVRQLEAGDAMNAVAFVPDGQTIGVATRNGDLRLWDVRSWQAVLTQSLHSSSMLSLAFSPTDGLAATSGSDGYTNIWHVARREFAARLPAQSAEVLDLASHADDCVATAHVDGSIKIWNVKRGRLERTIAAHAGPVWSVSIDPIGGHIASAGEDGAVKTWNRNTGRLIRALRGHSGPVYSASLSPDSRRVASAGNDKTIKVWDRSSGRLLDTLEGHTARVWSVRFSPNGLLLASTSDDYSVRIWDSRSGALLHTLLGHAALVRLSSFSPDGARLASASSDNTVMIWDVRTGALVHTLSGHLSSVKTVCFSPDGKLLASGGFGNLIKIWDVRTWREVDELPGHSNDINALAFLSDSQSLVSSGPDGKIKLWRLPGKQPELTIVNLPDGEWLAYKQNTLNYTGSRGAEAYAAVRFDNELSRLSPLFDFVNKLRRDDLSDMVALDQPAPNNGHAITESSDGLPLWIWPTGAAAIALAVLGFVLLRKESVPAKDKIADFFSQAGYNGVKLLTAQLYWLRPGNNRRPGLALCWRDDIDIDNKSQTIADRQLRKAPETRLYIVYDSADNRIEHLVSLRNELPHKLIPVSTALLQRALADGNCTEMLHRIDQHYDQGTNPYRSPETWHDPVRFFGRHEVLDRLPQELRNGRNVVLSGIRRVGLTSLARQIRSRLHDVPTTFLDCAKVAIEPRQVGTELIKPIYTFLMESGISNLPNAVAILKSQGIAPAMFALFDAWQMAGHNKPFVLIFDNFEHYASEQNRNQLDLYKHVIQLFEKGNRCFSALVTVRDGAPERNQLADMLPDAEFEHIGFLSGDQSRVMIQGLGLWRNRWWQPEAAHHLFQECAGHPYLTLRYADYVCQQSNARDIELAMAKEAGEQLRAGIAENEAGRYFEKEVWAYRTEAQRKLLRLMGTLQERGAVIDDIPSALSEAWDELEALSLVADDLGRIGLLPRLFADWIRSTQL